MNGYQLDARLWMFSCIAWMGAMMCAFHIFPGPLICIACVLVNAVLVLRARPWRR